MLLLTAVNSFYGTDKPKVQFPNGFNCSINYAIVRFIFITFLRQIVFEFYRNTRSGFSAMADDTAHSFRHKVSYTDWPDSPVVQTTEQAIVENGSKSARDPQNQLLVAEDFIRGNIYNSVSIADIAIATGVNIRSLQRLFRKFRGITPVQALLNFRIAAAHEIILNGEAVSVRELAAKFHFSNPGRFSKLYRKTYSCTPSGEIRSQHGRAATGASISE